MKKLLREFAAYCPFSLKQIVDLAAGVFYRPDLIHCYVKRDRLEAGPVTNVIIIASGHRARSLVKKMYSYRTVMIVEEPIPKGDIEHDKSVLVK